MTITVHTGANVAAAQARLEILQQTNVAPSAWIGGHAHQVDNVQQLIDAAQQGAWISLNDWKPKNFATLLPKLQALKDANVLHRVRLSHDGNLFPFRGQPRSINFLFGQGRDQFATTGFTADEWDLLTRVNPTHACAVRVRRLRE